MSNLILPPSSAASDLGIPIIKTSSTHDVYTWKGIKFWAEGGRIKIVRESDGEYTSCSFRDFLVRTAVLDAAVKKLTHSDERRDHQRLVQMQVTCLEQAKAQGDPHNPKVLAEKVRGGPLRTVHGFQAGRTANLDLVPKYPDGSLFKPARGPGSDEVTVRQPGPVDRNNIPIIYAGR